MLLMIVVFAYAFLSSGKFYSIIIISLFNVDKKEKKKK